MNATTDRFAEALSDVGASPAITTSETFEADLRGRIDAPAVGVPLDLDGCSLDDLPVELDPTPAEIEAAATGVTPTVCGIADTGSVVLEGTDELTEAVSLYPRRHVAVVAASDVVADLGGAMDVLGGAADGGMSGVVATGPSATADMGALVEGVHGPSTVVVLVVTDR